MKKVNRGFTLVELIVVITILSVLGTISFLSIQGYNKFARNAIRVDNVGKIAAVIDEKKLIGTSILSMTFTGSEVENAQISGTGAIIGGNYRAGNFNAITLEIKESQFQDPLSRDLYKVGVTTLKQGVFEIATTLEGDSGEDPLIVGTYTPRTQEMIGGVSSTGSFQVSIQDYSKIGKFLIGDTVTGSLVAPGTSIQSISRDGMTFVLNTETIAGTGDIALANSEVEGLIEGIGGFPVTNSGTDVAYSVKVSSGSANGGLITLGGGSGTSSSGGAVAGPAGAVSPITTWTGSSSSISMTPPDSDAFNEFTVDSAYSNSPIIIEIGNQNATISTLYGNDNITTGYGNNDITASGGNNTIVVGDGFNEISLGSSGTNNVTLGNGDNLVTTPSGGNITVNGGSGNNTFTLGYGNSMLLNLGDGNNTINLAGGNTVNITIGNGDNTITPSGSINNTASSITFGNGTNVYTGVGGSPYIYTGTSGTGTITFGNNQSQRLIWRGGNVTLNDYRRYGNNRISFANISDINTCTDVTNNLIISGSQATITSTYGTLIINIQDGTDLNGCTRIIF